MSLNKYFDFSRRQLWFLAAFCAVALLLAGWLVTATFILPRPEPAPLAILTGAPEDAAPPGTSDRVGGFVLDPNSAPVDSLELLPGIGPVKAARIVAYREKQQFKTVDDLTKVNGIGPGTLDMIRPFLKVSPK